MKMFPVVVWWPIFFAVFLMGISEGFQELPTEGFTEGFEVVNGVTDFTLSANCRGSWFIYSDGLQASAEEDQCGGDNDAIEQGDPTYTGVTPAGTAAGQDAVVLDGTGDFFEVLDGSDAFDTQNYTIGCWVLQDSAATEVIYRKNSTDLNIQIQASTLWRGHNSGDQGQSSVGSAIVASTWTHLALRRDTGTDEVELFHNALDCCDGGTCTATADRVFDDSNLGLGDAAGGAAPLTGRIMECFYQAEALTNTQLCEIMLCGFDGTADGEARDTAFGATGCECSDVACC